MLHSAEEAKSEEALGRAEQLYQKGKASFEREDYNSAASLFVQAIDMLNLRNKQHCLLLSRCNARLAEIWKKFDEPSRVLSHLKNAVEYIKQIILCSGLSWEEWKEHAKNCVLLGDMELLSKKGTLSLSSAAFAYTDAQKAFLNTEDYAAALQMTEKVGIIVQQLCQQTLQRETKPSPHVSLALLQAPQKTDKSAQEQVDLALDSSKITAHTN